MIELTQSAIHMWVDFWKDGLHLWLFLLSFCLLFIINMKHKKKEQKFLLLYVILLIIAFFCPVFVYVIGVCLGDRGVYWRVLWLLPVILVIAYVATICAVGMKKNLTRYAFVVIVIAAFAVGGKSVFQADMYQKPVNRQQVPDDVAVICEMIQKDAAGQEVYVAADDYLASYIRVYDPAFKMPYGRRGEDYVDRYALRMYQLLSYEPGQHIGACVKAVEALGCNYFVSVIDPAYFETSLFEDYGLEQIGTVGNYHIFRNSI